MKATIPIGTLLHDCTAGRTQSVGLMQVVPLLSDAQDEVSLGLSFRAWVREHVLPAHQASQAAEKARPTRRRPKK